MERLTAIGTGIVGKIAEYTVEPVGRQVGYVLYYNRNLRKLQIQVRDLDAARESVEHKIVEEQRKGRRVEIWVINWLTDVNKITGEAQDFLKDEHQAKIKCLYGFCPNLMARHYLSRKSTKLVQDVAELYGKKDFANIAFDLLPEEVCVLSTNNYEAYDSRTSVVKNIMDELRSYNTDMIGVYGIGGVGKTTLVKEIYKQATKGERLFDEVVMVLDLKQNPSIERIQKEIAEKLGLNFHEIETPAGRARHICSRIAKKKTLIILDDVWENIDLEVVGLPRIPTLKILLTSRSKMVLSRDMGTQKEFPLDVLDEKEAWSLFQKIAGDIVKNPDIQTVATQIAKKCGGLPLLIVTVARALKNSPLHAWKDTLRQLKRLDGQSLTDQVYSAIEWSYSKLETEEVKSLFILCGVVVGTTNTFSIVDLWKYSMGLDLLKNVDTIGEAWDALDSLLKNLKDSCLVLDDIDDNTRVRMHVLVKEVAKGIASRKQHVLSFSYGSELKEWPDEEFWEKCTMINLDTCNIPKLPDVLPCQELTFFRLISSNDDSSREIPCNFFKEMKKLSVLDLTNVSIPLLPLSLQFLKSLWTLCLHHCTLEDIALVGRLQNLEILSFLHSKFKQLPKEIGQLIRLRLLDLTGCSQLEVISPNVLSSLKRLEHLRMRNSFNRWEVGRVASTKRSNANLEELKHLHQLTTLQIHIPDAHTLPSDLFTNKLERFQICIGSAWKWDDVDEALNTLKLTTSNELDQGLKLLLKRTEDLYLEGMDGVNNSIVYQLGTEGFQQLKHLHIQNSSELAYNINGKMLEGLKVQMPKSSIHSQESSCISLPHFNLNHIILIEDLNCKYCRPSVDDNYAQYIVQDLSNFHPVQVMLPNLSSLVIHRCNGLRFMLSSSTARSLIQLKHLEITECQMLEEIVSTKQYGGEITGNMLPHLQQLKLKDLPNLARFSSESCIVFSSLKTLKVVDCAKLTKFMFDPLNKRIAIYKETEGGDLKENLQTVVQHFICDGETVVLPNLTSLIVHRLDGLSFLLSSSMARSIVQFRHHEISEPQITEEIVSATGHGEENLDDMFSMLELLEQNYRPSLTKFGGYIEFPYIQKRNIVECIKLETVFDPVSKNIAIYKEIKETQSEENLESVVHSFLFGEKSLPVVLRYITRLIIHRCHGLSFLLSSDMARTLVQLKHVEISECQIMKEIVFLEECSEANIDDMLPKLEQLVLNDLPNLTRFCSGSYIEFPSLERLKLEKCIKLETFISYPLRKSIPSNKEIEERDTEENLESGVPYFLFDKKVGFPKLERLTINDLPKLTKIWGGGSQLSENSFCKLRDVTVQQCNSLTNILPQSIIAGVFQQLQKLKVENCGVLEEIVYQEEGETSMPDLPKVTCLEFRSLPQLKRFHPMMHFKWPLLETLELFDCRIVDIFDSGFSGLPKTSDSGGLRNPVKQPVVLIEKSSFPKLEDLTLGPMDIWYGPPAPAAVNKHAVFPGISSRLTDLKTLRLHGMEKLMRLWEENTEPAGPVFLQLKTLEVKFCGLNNIELSAISFKNLTNLEVTFCWRLQYLTTYPVARSLVHLKKLKVDDCKSMKEILANDGDGEVESNCEIVFRQLEHLELSDLISLEWFCSRNCTVKVPLLETSGLVVNWCSLKLKISSDKTLEEVDSNMHLNVQKSHSRKEEAEATTEAAGSLETNQKQPPLNASESEHGVEAVIQETAINSQNMEHAKVMELNQKQVVTNTSKNLQEADFRMQENTLMQPLNLGSKEGKQFQFQADSKLEAEIRHLQELLRTNEAETRHLIELLRAKVAEMRDKEQNLAEERLASIDPKGIS